MMAVSYTHLVMMDIYGLEEPLYFQFLNRQLRVASRTNTRGTTMNLDGTTTQEPVSYTHLFTNSRNLIVAAVILVCALGFNSVGGVGFTVGSVTINLSGLAVAAIAGILLNAILPGNDYEFDATAGSDAATSGNLQV